MKVIDHLKSFLHFQRGIVESTKNIVESSVHEMEKRLCYQSRANELNASVMNSIKMGISDSKIASEEVIVCLTTHSFRINDVHLAIESIMLGTILPNRIILWLSNEYKNTPLPITLQNQMKRGLEVLYCKDIRSYTKLVPALRLFPNSVIITIDDDIIYPIDMLEHLVKAYNSSDRCICANWVHTIPRNLKEKYISLLEWPLTKESVDDTPILFYEGFAGVLYPPDSFDEEVLNEDVFLDICKFADDVWFNAMSLKRGTKVRCANPRPGLLNCIVNPNVQSIALANINSKGEIMNDVQVKLVFNKYKIFDIIEAYVNDYDVKHR